MRPRHDHGRGGIVTGWGIAVPDKVVTNDDLSVTLDTNDAWIQERTGIRERRIGGTTSRLAIEAGLAALEKAGRRPDEIDAVILATTTPDQIVPGTSATVQDGIGVPGGAFDVNAACSGFVYALAVAHGMLAIGAERLLVIGSETLSRITDWDDRSVAVLVGDGAGAVVLEAVDGPGQLLSWNLGADGSLRHLLKCDHGGYLYMDGKEIFRKAVRVVVESAEQAIAEAGLTTDDIDLDRAPPGQPPDHHRGLPAAGDPRGEGGGGHRPLRQHLVGVDPAGPGRRARDRAAAGGAPRPAHRVRRGHDLGQRRATLGRVSRVRRWRPVPGGAGRRHGPPLRRLQAAGPDRTQRRGGHRPAGERRRGRPGFGRIVAGPPSRDGPGHPLPRRAVLAGHRSRWPSPSSACRSAPSTPCWPPRRRSAATALRRGQRRRRLRRGGHGPAGRPARSPAPPSTSSIGYQLPVHRGHRRPGHPGDLRGGSPTGHLVVLDRAPPGHPARHAGRTFASDDGLEPRELDRRRAGVGQSVGIPAGHLGGVPRRPWTHPASTRTR